MAKVTGPILSMDAQGQIAKSQVYGRWRGIQYARRYAKPSNPNTTAQKATRTVFSALQYLFKVMGGLARAPWLAAVTGRPLTDRNMLTKTNLPLMRGKADRSDFIGSPGALGGLPASAVVAVGGAGSGEIDVTVSTLTPPSGWMLTSCVAVAMPQGSPEDQIPGLLAEAENAAPTSPGDTVVSFSGLEAGTEYVVSAWPVWSRPDGVAAYGPSITTTATATV